MAKQIIRHLEFYGFPDQNNFMSEPCIDSCIDRKQEWEIHKIGHDLYTFRHFQKGFNDKTIEINNQQNDKINELIDKDNELQSAVTKNEQDIIAINNNIDGILDVISSITEDVNTISGDLNTFKDETNDKFNEVENTIDSFSGEFITYSAETSDYLKDYSEWVDLRYAHQDNTYTKAEVYNKDEVDDIVTATKTWVRNQEYLTEASGDTLYVRKPEYTTYTASTEVRLAALRIDVDATKVHLGDLSGDTIANFNMLNNTVRRIDGELQNHISGNTVDINNIRGDINTINSRLATDEANIANKADRNTTDAQYNDLNSKLNSKTDTSAFTDYQGAVNATLAAHQNDLARLDNVKADKTAVTNSFNDEIAAREAADNFLSGKVDTNISDIAALESKDIDHEVRMTNIEADLAQEVTNRQNGDTALIGSASDASTADTINGAKKYAREREAAANVYTDTVTASTLGQSKTYTDLQIGNITATISGLATKGYVDAADNQVRADMQTLISQTANSVSQQVIAETNRAMPIEAGLRLDVDSLGDSLNSVDNLVHKITDWDGTGTYTGSGNGAMDKIRQDLNNITAQFNGLIVTLTNKGILP